MTGKEKLEKNTGKRQESRKTGRSNGASDATNRTAGRQKAAQDAEHPGGKVFKATNRTAEREKARTANRKKPVANKADHDGNQEVGRWVQIRLIPIWLRILLFLLGVLIAAMLGVMFGYGVLGDGKASDALKPETWQHILKMINGDV
ncbi:DNA-directed RNA polymerase subunit beta [Bhargavaea beijingensis]|uniref:DNA-directed RNA polymerase subunit beta n=1 Tax=Bhargavaea beijingensis TaxID=426756 RepID=A0A1G7DVV6_9BACL|nr:DNA-directed RNA polymerase subunit beta [Bhargavaea beijingensis]MCW1928872.1 DNA-directed RNA polymerase subunit beta [Bhargavaea beijingensis]RSK29953.1 DNA-directed RNA polymerase subunit beta [Bhargavaea beijingensis]SDE55594.1 DNA-directed RNA polymerase subunit beta [Bhargavaea beijingensis]